MDYTSYAGVSLLDGSLIKHKQFVQAKQFIIALNDLTKAIYCSKDPLRPGLAVRNLVENFSPLLRSPEHLLMMLALYEDMQSDVLTSQSKFGRDSPENKLGCPEFQSPWSVVGIWTMQMMQLE